jgi:hypothetical protein
VTSPVYLLIQLENKCMLGEVMDWLTENQSVNWICHTVAWETFSCSLWDRWDVQWLYISISGISYEHGSSFPWLPSCVYLKFELILTHIIKLCGKKINI